MRIKSFNVSGFALALLCLSGAGCIKPRIVAKQELNVLFRFQETEDNSSTLPTSLVGYRFRDSRLVSSSTYTINESSCTTLEAEKKDVLFFVSDVENILQTEDHAEFVQTVFPQNVWYGEISVPDATYDVYTVTMKSGSVRIDFEIENPEQTVITEVVFENAPKSLVPFGTPETERLVKTAEEGESIGSQKGLFEVCAMKGSARFTLKGTQGSEPVILSVEIPSFDSERAYRIVVLGAGADLRGIFRAAAWEDGETVIAKPDTFGRIMIDEQESSVPAGVSIRAEDNTVLVPNTGADQMTLAFSSDTPVRIASSTGVFEGVTLSEMRHSQKSGKYVSSFDLAIPSQGKGRLGYTVEVNLRHALLEDSYDCVKVVVEASDKLIEHAAIAGNVWMAFNGVGADLDSQIYLMDGIPTVEQMYLSRWPDVIGYLYQFGRMTGYIPWQGYSSFGGDRDAPWKTDGKMPCPPGWRIPTRDELNTLLPANTTVPGTYTSAGDEISASFLTATNNLQTETGRNGTPLILKLTSKNSGESLYLPLAGQKSDKNRTNDPGFGSQLCLWADVLSNTGGYAYGHKVTYNADAQTATFAVEHRPAEAFCYVRCIKSE